MTDKIRNINRLFPSSSIKGGTLLKVILGLIILVVAVVLLAIWFTQGIADTAKDQLKALKQGDYAKAYNMTTKAFQNVTSFESFQVFAKKYPSLGRNKSATFYERTINNNVGYLKGTLVGEDDSKVTVEYQLIKEDNTWKIQALRLSPIGIQNSENTSAPPPSKFKIHAILISDKADKDGYVDEENLNIPFSAKRIYATIQIIAPQTGNKISAILKYLPTNEQIGPAEGEITKTGNIMKAFSFTRTNKAWPKGDYMIITNIKDVETKSATFHVK